MPAGKQKRFALSECQLRAVRIAALDKSPVRGNTHRFYQYPARFSPIFCRAVIEQFSKPGDVVLDPFMGGGTTIVEAMLAGRRAIGSDLNSLSVFITKAKVSPLSPREVRAVEQWATSTVPTLRCNGAIGEPQQGDRTPKNMHLAPTRWLKKTIAQCLAAAETDFPSPKSVRFARCVLLNVGQWALNGRHEIPTAAAFRDRVASTAMEMLAGMRDATDALAASGVRLHTPVLRQVDAEQVDRDTPIREAGPADLVVTSPPYPGIHMLYHRWQVDGRKESDAPYWIAACDDGCGASFYNFADRKREAEDKYFEKALDTFSSIRRVMRKRAVLAQMIAFSDASRQLRPYLELLQRAGFREMRNDGERRIWRSVPRRKWHASTKGNLPSSREAVLLHEAI